MSDLFKKYLSINTLITECQKISKKCFLFCFLHVSTSSFNYWQKCNTFLYTWFTVCWKWIIKKQQLTVQISQKKYWLFFSFLKYSQWNHPLCFVIFEKTGFRFFITTLLSVVLSHWEIVKSRSNNSCFCSRWSIV
jgi:hypothetical protein